jgi:hypothetical protein
MPRRALRIEFPGGGSDAPPAPLDNGGVPLPPIAAQRHDGNVAVYRMGATTAARQHDAAQHRWTGARTLVLGPQQTAEDVLADIRRRPRLALVTAPQVLDVRDTAMLWAAWRPAALETAVAVAEVRALLRLQAVCDVDAEAAYARLRDLREQLQGTAVSWQQHRQFLEGRAADLQARIHAQQQMVATEYAKLATRVQALRGDERSLGAVRVVTNAVQAMEGTYDERRQLWRDARRQIHQGFQRAGPALARALTLALAGLGDDLEDLVTHVGRARAQASAGEAAAQKRWCGVCRRLQANFDTHVRQPLLALVREDGDDGDHTESNDGGLGALALAGGALDDTTDPYCVRRCEVALAELQRLQAHTRPPPTTAAATVVVHDDPLDDVVLQAARRTRSTQVTQTTAAVRERREQLQAAQAARAAELEQARTHLRRLEQAGVDMRQRAEDQWGALDGDAARAQARQAAALQRAVTERETALKQDMGVVQQHVKTLAQQVAAHHAKAEEARVAAGVEWLDGVVRAALALCRRMRRQFEGAVAAEGLLRRLARDQFMEGAQAAHGACTTVLRATLALAQARLAQVAAAAGAYNDRAAEATRRIHTLDQARVRQEMHVDGPEIAAYTAVNAYAAEAATLHTLRDAWAEVEDLLLACDVARDILTMLQHQADGFQRRAELENNFNGDPITPSL